MALNAPPAAPKPTDEQPLHAALVLNRVPVGTWTSSPFPRRGANLVVELIPIAAGSAATADVLDAGPGGSFGATLDPQGNQAGVAAYLKFQVDAVQDQVQLRLTVTAGSWSARVSWTESPRPATTTSGAAVTVANGADVALGATGDAAVVTNAAGTLSGKLRGLVAILADVWQDAANALQVLVSGGGIHVAASTNVNDGIALDVNAAVAAAPGLRLLGYAVRESAAVAAVATVRLVHGATVAAGTTLVPLELAANGSETRWFGPQGLACPNGLSIAMIAGTADVELFYAVVA